MFRTTRRWCWWWRERRLPLKQHPRQSLLRMMKLMVPYLVLRVTLVTNNFIFVWKYFNAIVLQVLKFPIPGPSLLLLPDLETQIVIMSARSITGMVTILRMSRMKLMVFMMAMEVRRRSGMVATTISITEVRTVL